MNIEIEEQTCVTSGCGVTFWLSKEFCDYRRKDKHSFSCPNGHAMSYAGETEAQKLFRMTKEKNEEIERLQGELRKALMKKGRGRPRKSK